MKKGFVMNTKIIGLVLALVLLFFILQLIFPKILDANSQVHSLKCKFVPFGCDEEDYEDSNNGVDEKDSFEKAVLDPNKVTRTKFTKSELMGIVSNAQCLDNYQKNGQKAYLLKSTIDGENIYIFHIKSDSAEDNIYSVLNSYSQDFDVDKQFESQNENILRLDRELSCTDSPGFGELEVMCSKTPIDPCYRDVCIGFSNNIKNEENNCGD